jgi:hypothetical protein
MWEETRCDRCGDCFLECPYVDWDRTRAVEEISRLAFLCPMCRQTLRRVCEQQGLSQVGVSDLCRMALGEKVRPPDPASGLHADRG